ncbi:MAG: DUF1570 domain-containing protein [Pirellulaceae bacterium]
MNTARHGIRFVFLWALGLFLLDSGADSHAEDFTIELQLDGRRVAGKPLAWSRSEVFLLGRDGVLWDFAPTQASNYRKTASIFRPYTQGELRGQLMREFGDGFDVSGTGHYLVVHPAGQRDTWAPRFEELYRSFLHYFTVRGWRPEKLEFPLVAVVFPRQQDFVRYAMRDNGQPVPGTLGYYSPVTNRILLYDVTAGKGNQANWHVNADTIIHEATHQTAFNAGVHSRFSMPPRWVAEGLATMFEAPGVWNSRRYTALRDRINRGRFTSFRSYAAGRRRDGRLAQFIASDHPFHTDPEGAYAEAWALTFFLVEKRPRKYIDYLRRTTSRPAFRDYQPADRLADFAEIFGQDLALLEAHYLRFINQLQ